jgi:hypothetical protein
MIRIALDLRRHAILHGHEQGAGIGAIMRAGAPDEGLGHRIIQKKRRETNTLYDSRASREGAGVPHDGRATIVQNMHACQASTEYGDYE